jgi:hypothetical protein
MAETRTRFMEDIKSLDSIPSHIVMEWGELCHRNTCYMCSHKFDNGIIRKMPKDNETPFSLRLTGEFLWHMTETHGIWPEDVVNSILKRFPPAWCNGSHISL